MGSNLSLALGLAAAVVLGFATPSYAQRSQHPHAAEHQRAHSSGKAAGSAYGHAPSEGTSMSEGHEPGQCYIAVDTDHDLGYWGSCSTKGARPVR